eukprot:12655675-Alexandrium_andersonii.AAC.1
MALPDLSEIRETPSLRVDLPSPEGPPETLFPGPTPACLGLLGGASQSGLRSDTDVDAEDE